MLLTLRTRARVLSTFNEEAKGCEKVSSSPLRTAKPKQDQQQYQQGLTTTPRSQKERTTGKHPPSSSAIKSSSSSFSIVQATISKYGMATGFGPRRTCDFDFEGSSRFVCFRLTKQKRRKFGRILNRNPFFFRCLPVASLSL